MDIQNWFHTNVNSDGAVPKSKIDLTLYYCDSSAAEFQVHIRFTLEILLDEKIDQKICKNNNFQIL